MVAVNRQDSLDEAFQNVPAIDLNQNPFTLNQCFLVIALPVANLNQLIQQLFNSGYQSINVLNNADINEMFMALQHENYIFEKVHAELRRRRLEHTFIVNQGSKAELLRLTLSMGGHYVDGMLNPTEELPSNSLLIAPIENAQQKAAFEELNQRCNGRVLPLYEDELTAADHYWQLHRVFYNYFDANNAADFVARYEDEINRILSAYDEVDVCMLNVKDGTQVMTACALASLNTNRRVLHLAMPSTPTAVGDSDFLLKKLPDRIRVLTSEQREFWRYFIKKRPSFFTYSSSVYDYYALRYAYEELKIDSGLIKFTDEELKATAALTGEYVVFSIAGASDWYDEVARRLMQCGIQSVRLEGGAGQFS